MRISQKVKIFDWRACRYSLPIVQNLRKKKIEVEERCVFYQQPKEDLFHALFYCPIYRWWCSYLPFLSTMPKKYCLLNLVGWILNKREQLEDFFCITQGVWGCRNKKIYEDVNSDPIQTIDSAIATKESFHQLITQPPNPRLFKSSQRPPLVRSLKFNVDKALFEEVEKVDFILKDSSENALLVATICKVHVENPIVIESLAILMGLQHCLNQRISNLIVESDYQLVVSKILQVKHSFSPLENLYQDIMGTMSRFKHCSIQFANEMCICNGSQASQECMPCTPRYAVVFEYARFSISNRLV